MRSKTVRMRLWLGVCTAGLAATAATAALSLGGMITTVAGTEEGSATGGEEREAAAG